MRRRDFIALLGSAAAWPLAARAQPADRMRRIGVLMVLSEDDPQSRSRVAAFQQGLDKLGWTVGRNLAIDYRWGVSNPERARTAAAELLGLAPDLILANATLALIGAQQATRTVPIVFTGVSEPVSQGFVASLARPGGNTTGIHEPGAERGRQMGRAAQGDGAPRHPRRTRVQPGLDTHSRAIRPCRGGGGCQARFGDGRGAGWWAGGDRGDLEQAGGRAGYRFDLSPGHVHRLSSQIDRRADRSPPVARHLFIRLFPRRRRPGVLRARCHRSFPALRGVCRPDLPRRGRPAICRCSSRPSSSS